MVKAIRGKSDKELQSIMDPSWWYS